ncbi:MAG TPA: toxic anion resistance protein [Acidimicrobiia bacterium]|nr:toxic anion resistance protein [Acidimicrobiia bacterium]
MTTNDPEKPVEPLAPPLPGAELTLTPPAPVGAVEASAAATMVPLDQTAVPALDQMVADYVASVVALDEHSPELDQKAESIRTMGDDDIRAAANFSNRLLDSPVRSMSKGKAGENVGASLLALRRQVEELDPSKASGVRKLLGIIPFGDKLRDYFHRYESAQSHLNGILNALYAGQDELRKDNAALEQEKLHLWDTMQRLAQYVYVAEHLDKALTARIAAIETTDHERAKALKQDLLFYARQKHQDLLTQLAVSIQGYLAVDLVRRNNIELIKGVDRATTTTISALRTAVIVAQALANQKLVLDQIAALNTTTSNMIESTSKLLATQTVSINEQAASSTVGIDKLEAAFANIYQTIDAIDTFKVQALSSMQATIDSLNTQIEKAQTYLARARQSELRGNRPAGELDVPVGE